MASLSVPPPSLPPIPVTVFTGFLGSGKTTIILGLLPQLPTDYKVVLLKNEYGDVEVDSQLAKQSSLAAVSEILNGCMCCVLVGQMKTALLEIRDDFRPDRIIIESSGSAFPATLAFQIRDLERETGDFKLDAIVTVIDAENFTGYEDTSVTAKMQAQYTDMILVNKAEHVTERQLDIVMDHLFTLNEHTPKLRCQGKEGVAPSLIFGLDSKLWVDQASREAVPADHHSEVETATIGKGQSHNEVPGPDRCGSEAASCSHNDEHSHSHKVNSEAAGSSVATAPVTKESLSAALDILPKESVYRVKGFVRFAPADGNAVDNTTHILNWAFGRWDLTPRLAEEDSAASTGIDPVLLTMMGEPGEVKRIWAPRLAARLGVAVREVRYHTVISFREQGFWVLLRAISEAWDRGGGAEEAAICLAAIRMILLPA